jgi:hypothetical protein
LVNFTIRMLCELSEFAGDSLFGIWLVMNLTMVVSIFTSSSLAFYHFYWPTKITYGKWQYKV